jgi:fluoride exporter
VGASTMRACGLIAGKGRHSGVCELTTRNLAVEKIVYIALAGAAGTLTRYGVGTLFHRDGVAGMPWGVFVANMIGALLFGLIWAASEERGWISENMRVIALVGFMGAFTTFSTFAFDNVQMARASEWGWFGANMVLTNVGGLAAVYAGFRIARVG